VSFIKNEETISLGLFSSHSFIPASIYILNSFYESQVQLISFQIWDNNFLHSLKYCFENGFNVRYLSSHNCNVNNADHNQPIIRLRQPQDIKIVEHWRLQVVE
jgi:hypothetical protein